MKTIKEWLSELPDGYRELALANVREINLSKEHNSMNTAISAAFVWSESPEKYRFWRDVTDCYFSNEKPKLSKLPKLPTNNNKMKTYTLDEIKKDNSLVIFIENEEQWNKIYKVVGKDYITTRYSGAYCYKLYNRTFAGTSTKYNSGAYHNATIIQFNQIADFIGLKEERELLGYNLKEEFKKFKSTVLSICNLKNLDGRHEGIDIYADGTKIEVLKEAGVLDIWFEPVYKPTIPDITINGYKGEFFDNYVKFGCAKVDINLFKDLNSIAPSTETYKIIESVTIGKGVFTMAQVREIAEYYNKKK